MRVRRRKKGNQKKKAYPTIFMKTKEDESDKLASPTMLMKTHAVSRNGGSAADRHLADLLDLQSDNAPTAPTIRALRFLK